MPDAVEFHATADAVIGTPAWAIIEYAEAHDIDLIVMGTHGRGGMSHLLMGSVAERVVRTAPCPVLTVRSAPKGAPMTEVAAKAGEDVPPVLVETSTADKQC
jgi:hypothetical protein